MKVGIVTQPLYANYGGILQNYALQQVLKKMGHIPVTLDYMPSLSFGRYLLYAGKGILYSPFPIWRHPIKPYKHFLERPADIDTFVHNHIVLTRTLSRYTNRALHKYGIEALIVGSDQVWRYSYNAHYIRSMFLAFANNNPVRKIAYGTSFGVEYWDYPSKETHDIRLLAQHFDAVSVREESGAILCRERLGVTAQIVLDPTLLLDVSDYEQFCSNLDPREAPYLAAYVLDLNNEKNAYIQAVADSKNLTIKRMTVSDKEESVEEWLSIIRNAAYVITDSYHGSLFSILFKKPFQTIINKERGADRFLTIFKRLGIQDHLLDTIPSSPVPESGTDDALIQTRLDELRKDSIAFLCNALK